MKSRNFRFLVFTRFISVIGDEAALIALLFRVKGEGPWATATLFAGTSLAMFLTAPWVGRLVDRSSAKKLLVISSFLQAIVCFAMVFSPSHLALALNLLLGVGQSVVVATTAAWTPALVESDDLGKALSHMQAAYAVAAIAGYGIGGLLVGHVGIESALALDGLSFLLLIPMLLMVKKDRIGNPTLDADGKLEGGYRIVWRNPQLRAITITIVAYITLLMMFSPLEIYLTTDILGADATGYGIISMSFAIGMTVGSLLLARSIQSDWKYARLSVWVLFLSGLSMIAIGLSPNLTVLFGVLLVCGILVSGMNVFTGPLIVGNAQESELGRVNASIGALNSIGNLVGTALGGLLGGFLPVRVVIVASGVLAIASLLFTSRGLLSAELPAEQTAN